MICISVTPSSRTLAPADMLNAARHGDLIELCLDNFIKEPNVGDLLRVIDKPVLVSCRRPQEGGQWKGSDSERLQLLRTAIVAGPAYVELDIETAAKVPPFGQTRRVISYTSLDRPLTKIDTVFEECEKARADIVKVTWPTDSLDSAWPMLSAITEARDIPVVGFGIGKAGLTFSLLGRKYGSPWIYAALERGMEAFPEQPTVWELRGDYSLDDIDRKTRFLGIIGFGHAENTAARILNAAFRMMEKPIRCLPLIPKDLKRLPKMLGVMKINGLIVDPAWDGDLTPLLGTTADGDAIAHRPDVIMQKSEGWSGIRTLADAVNGAGRRALESDQWAGKGTILICGTSATARTMAEYFSRLGGAVSLAAPSDNTAASAARTTGVRHVAWNAVHDLRLDTLIVADTDLACGTSRQCLNPMAIRERMNFVDLSAYPRESAFGEEARARGARYIEPSAVFAEQLRLQFKSLTGRDLPEDAFRLGLSDL